MPATPTRLLSVASDDIRIRRVGFRAGTDAELTALHAVEAPIQAERGSDRMPKRSSPTSPSLATCRRNSRTTPGWPRPPTAHRLPPGSAGRTRRATRGSWSATCSCFAIGGARASGLSSSPGSATRRQAVGGRCSRGRRSTPCRPVMRSLGESAPRWRGSTARTSCASPTSTGRWSRTGRAPDARGSAATNWR